MESLKPVSPGENFYDASQVETPTSEHAIETAVKAAVTADNAL
jgi:hypothetical protein